MNRLRRLNIETELLTATYPSQRRDDRLELSVTANIRTSLPADRNLAPMPHCDLFRVVGVRADGTREICTTGCVIGTAEAVRTALVVERSFASVLIEKQPIAGVPGSGSK